jgi:hypothetical protein
MSWLPVIAYKASLVENIGSIAIRAGGSVVYQIAAVALLMIGVG